MLAGKDFGTGVVLARLSPYSIRIDYIYSVPGIHCHAYDLRYRTPLYSVV